MNTVAIDCRTHYKIVEDSIFRRRLPWKNMFWVLIGLGLCSSIPIFKLGPSFITWLSSSEIAGIALLLISTGAYIHIKRDRSLGLNIMIKKCMPIGILALSYIFSITILSTLYNHFPIVYPTWSLIRFLQWALIIPYILSVCKPGHLRLLIVGIVIGGIVNAFVSIVQKFGFLVPEDLVSHLNAFGAGPYGKIAQKGLVAGESIGLFSYTRIATGFFLSLSFFAMMIFLKNSLFKLFVLILFTCGIAFTGSKLGFSVFAFMTLALFFHRKFTPIIFLGFCFVSIFTMVYFQSIQDDYVLGRLTGASETYSSGIQQRLARQNIVFELPKKLLYLGCGIGNLGSTLGLANLRFYRAHGYFFTYLAEIGLVGVTLLSVSMYKLVKKIGAFRSYFGCIILVAIAFSGFVDDFMIPSAQSAHLPLIAMIVLRFSVLKSDHYIVIRRQVSKCQVQ